MVSFQELLEARHILLAASEATDINQLYGMFSRDATIFTGLIATINKRFVVNIDVNVTIELQAHQVLIRGTIGNISAKCTV